MSSSVEYQLENNMQLFEVHSLHSHHHADLTGNHTAVTWSLWGPRGCSMPTESPGPVQVQRCGARHEVKREEDGDVPSPSLPSTGPAHPSPCVPLCSRPPLSLPALPQRLPRPVPAPPTLAPPGRDSGPIASPVLDPPANREPPCCPVPGSAGTVSARRRGHGHRDAPAGLAPPAGQ